MDMRISNFDQINKSIEGATTSEQAIIQAGLDENYSKIPLLNPLDGTVLPDTFGVFRDSDNSFISTCGKNYEVLQNKHMFTWMDTMLNGQANYVGAGYFDGGKKIFIQAQPKIKIINGDEFKSFLTGINAHDGSMRYQLKLCLIRIICRNTFNRSLHAEFINALRGKHTKGSIKKTDEAIMSLADIEQAEKSLEEKFAFLATREVNGEAFIEVMKRVFTDYAVDGDEKNRTRTDNKVKSILEYFENNDNDANKAIRGTAYNLFNAIVEDSDFNSVVRRTSARQNYTIEQLRAESSLFGNIAELKEKALDVLVELAPSMNYRPWTQRITTYVPETNIFDAPKTSLLDEIINNITN